MKNTHNMPNTGICLGENYHRDGMISKTPASFKLETAYVLSQDVNYAEKYNMPISKVCQGNNGPDGRVK